MDRNPLGKLYQNLWITSSSYCKAQRQLLYVLSIEPHLWNKLNMLSCSSMGFSCGFQTSSRYGILVQNIKPSVIVASLLPCEGVRFVLNGTTYQNNSNVTLENIGDGDGALLCLTDLTVCCQSSYVSSPLGNWFFPNETRVPSSGAQWDFHRTRGQSVVFLRRRRGGVNGIYSCVIPVAMNVTQTIYIGVYSASTGE